MHHGTQSGIHCNRIRDLILLGREARAVSVCLAASGAFRYSISTSKIYGAQYKKSDRRTNGGGASRFIAHQHVGSTFSHVTMLVFLLSLQRPTRELQLACEAWFKLSVHLRPHF